MAQRVYAVGDIHGHLDKLREVHDWIIEDLVEFGGDGVVVHIGDLTDRGPDGAGVIRYLIDGISTGAPWLVLKGNHDRMMAMFLDDPERPDPKLRPDYSWLHPRLGGLTTLQSYGLDTGGKSVGELHRLAVEAIPHEHHHFLTNLETLFWTDDVVLVHAGIRPGITLDRQHEDDLVWIREPFLSDTRDHGQLIIHGHTPIDAPTHYGNRVNIDSSVAFGGPLTAVVIEGRTVWNLTESGRIPLHPIASN